MQKRSVMIKYQRWNLKDEIYDRNGNQHEAKMSINIV